MRSNPLMPFVRFKDRQSLRYLIYLTALLFTVGVFAPMLTISQLIVIRSSFSVYSGVLELFINGQFLLFILVAGFSIVVPLLKLWVLFRLTSPEPLADQKMQRCLSVMHEYGRWAMLDVLVVAILVVTVKLGTIASLQLHYGLYVFGAAVLLMMLITSRIVHLSQHA